MLLLFAYLLVLIVLLLFVYLFVFELGVACSVIHEQTAPD